MQGVALGLKSTITGVASGVSGLVEQPVKGAKKAGVIGFGKGVAKGV